jgi:DNA-binding Xre family transcriptional regulator
MKPITHKFFAELNKKRPSKINLALAEDIGLKAEEVSVYANNVSISIETLREVKNSLEVDLGDLTANLYDLEALLSDAEQVSSEIGVDVNNIPNYAEAKQTYETSVEQLREANNEN